MNSITQNMRYRESVMKYADRYGIKAAMRKFDKHKSYIYFWRERWLNGGRKIEALKERSKVPITSPNKHTEEEEKLIRNLCRRNPDIGEIDLWYKLKKRGYTRSLSGLNKALKRMNMKVGAKSEPSPTYKPKPYEQMSHPGERIQIDVKYVPRECIHPKLLEKFPDIKLYQYTSIDEYSRVRFLKGYDECSTYTSSEFLKEVVKYFAKRGVKVECVQTDNGPEFTKRFLTDNQEVEETGLFKRTANELGIKVKHIKPHTPRHNGKVERSHREDQKLFYTPLMKPKSKRKFFSLDDFNSKLKRHMDRTNNRPMRPLDMKTPLEYLELFHRKKEAKKD